MKKYLITLLVLFICINTDAQVKKTVSRQQKAELLIKKFMNENLNDFKSYEPIEYSKIDTLKSIFNYTELSTVMLNLAYVAMDYYEKSSDDIDLASYSTQREKLLPIAKEILETGKRFTISYPKIGIGWVINHKCRSKDERSNLMIGNWIFGFDKNIENIIFIKSEFPEGKKYISTDFLLNHSKLIDATKKIQDTILDYSNKLNKIKTDLYL